MDETPEELERIRREAEQIDPYKHRRRLRALAAVAVGAAAAGAVWVVLEAFDQSRNPCERVRDHLCAQDPRSVQCQSYESVFRESVEDPNPDVRSNIRAQCLTKIKRLKEDEGVEVP
jgi:hypothetical protein